MPRSPDGNRITVLWALPAAPEGAKLRAVVAELARQYDAPVFEPHLTLGLGGVEALARVPQRAFRLRVAALDFTAEFTKTLFLRFEPSPGLVAFRAALGLLALDDYDPHLSLLYRDLPVARKAAIARQTPLPLATVLFDQLAVISCPNPTSTCADVEAWKTVATRMLDLPPTRDPPDIP